MLLMTKASLLIAIAFLAVSTVLSAENEKEKSSEPAPSEPDAATFVALEIDEPSETPVCTCENTSKTQIKPQSKLERKSNKIAQSDEIKLAVAPTPVTIVLSPEEDSETVAPAEDVEVKTKANKENEAITKSEDGDETKEEVTISPKSKNSKSEKDKKSSKKRSKRDTKGKTSKRRESTKSKDGGSKNKNRKNRK